MGQSPDSSSYNEKGEGLPFFQGKAEFGRVYPTVTRWTTNPLRIAEANDILLSVRAPVGPTNLAAESCCIGRGLAAIRVDTPLNQKYLFYYFRNIEHWLAQQGTGSTFAGINSHFIHELEVPVAPLNEQKKIVEKLDTLLARVIACQARLDRVRLILNRFRQAVLSAATSGQLTEGWRKEEGISEPWQTVNLPQVSTSRLGKMLNEAKNLGTPTPYLRNANVRWFSFDLTDIQTIRITESERETFSVRRGDVFICEGGEPGRCAVWYGPDNAHVFQKALHRVRVGKELAPEWLCYCLKIAANSGRLEKLFTGTTISHLTGVALKQFEFELPSLAEQREIIRCVETLFSYADYLETRYRAAQTQVKHLTPALLSKAFRGELVPQDPNDEPASVLVERIRAERATKPEEPKRAKIRKPKRTKMTEESVKEAIRQLPEDKFSFDDLRSVIAGDYEQLKTILFDLLETEPSISQVFDESARAIRFTRSIK